MTDTSTTQNGAAAPADSYFQIKTQIPDSSSGEQTLDNLEQFVIDMTPSTRDRANKCRAEIDALTWLSPDRDCAIVTEAIRDAAERIKKHDLSIYDIIDIKEGRRTKRDFIGRYVIKLAAESGLLSNEECINEFNEQVREIGCRADKVKRVDWGGGAEIYYEAATMRFWAQETNGNFTPRKTDAIVRLLRSEGLMHKPVHEEELSEIEQKLHDTEQNHVVDLVANLAGYARGYHNIGGNRVLVSHDIRPIEPATEPLPDGGGFPHIWAMLDGLLGKAAESFIYNLKLSYESRRKGALDTGPANIIVGPNDCGKSLLVQQVVAPLLGGRSANARKFVCGQTTFNRDLQTAEVWVLDDESLPSKADDRRALTNAIKQVTASPLVRCETKGKDAFTASLFRRLYINLNEVDMDGLPDMEESLMDKINIYRATPFVMPDGLMPLPLPSERQAFAEVIRQELPYFAAALLAMEIPEDMRSRRFGVKMHHDAELLEGMQAVSANQTLWEEIQHALFGDGLGEESWEGTAIELRRILHEKHTGKGQLFLTAVQLGTKLGLLVKAKPDLIKKKRTTDSRSWVILRDDQPEPVRGRAGRRNIVAAEEE